MFEYLSKTKTIRLLDRIDSHFTKVHIVFFIKVIKTNFLKWHSEAPLQHRHFTGFGEQSFGEQSQERLLITSFFHDNPVFLCKETKTSLKAMQ